MDKKYIILIVALVLSLIFNIKAIFFPPNPNFNEEKYKNNLDSLNELIIYHEDKILQLNNENEILYNNIDSLNNQLIVNNNKIINLKQYYDKKMDSINNYTNNDISTYFTNRYK